MNRWNGDIRADANARRDAFGRINRAGLDVKQPASRIPYVLGGGLLGNQAAKYLGANRFWTGAATVAGAMAGNRAYNRANPGKDLKVAPGMVVKGW